MKALILFFITVYLFSLAALPQDIKRFDVVIDELFIDPSPQQGLPLHEFVELKNISRQTINLLDWTISNGKNQGRINKDYYLQPDSFVVVCTGTAAPLFQTFGPVIAASAFPSLDNDQGIIQLLSPHGMVVHQAAYDQGWYDNAVKSEGGWTLEMIDPHNPCTGKDNWKVSMDVKGGSPGYTNSVDGPNPDDTPPALLRCYTTDSLTVIAVFDEPVDTLTATMTSNYRLHPQIGNPVGAKINGSALNEVVLGLAVPLKSAMVYELDVGNITDCSGLSIGALHKTKLGFPSVAESADIVINEILFNPAKDGYDYVEAYNRSSKVIDLKQLYLANRNALGEITGLKAVQEASVLFYPGEYAVLTPDSRSLSAHYTIREPGSVFELSSFPTFPDDKGKVLLLNHTGTILDELGYDEKWHFALIADPSGVALERINYNAPTQDKNNWTSAAFPAGYGTPGYPNSQLRADLQARGEIEIEPKLFSPDNDGADDFGLIKYHMPEVGYTANLVIYNAAGNRVRYLLKNAILGIKGQLTWDGLDDRSLLLPSGIYILYTEIFNLAGKTKKFKNTIVLKHRWK